MRKCLNLWFCKKFKTLGSWCNDETNCKYWTYKRQHKSCYLYDSRIRGILDSIGVSGPANLVGSLSGSKTCFDYPCPMENKRFYTPHPEYKMPGKSKEVIDNWQDCGKQKYSRLR